MFMYVCSIISNNYTRMKLLNVINLLRTSRLHVTSLHVPGSIGWPVQCKKHVTSRVRVVCTRLELNSHTNCHDRTPCRNCPSQIFKSRSFSGVTTQRTYTLQTNVNLPVSWLHTSSAISSFRYSSSNTSNIDKDLEHVEVEIPASQTKDAVAKDAVAKDPELHSLLSEIAADFGKSESLKTAAETTVIDDHESSLDKLNPVKSNSEEDKTMHGFIAIATEDEEQVERDSDETEKTPPVESTRNASSISFVFIIDDIVDILRDENAQDICVIKVPPWKNYVDYFIVVTGRSTRHLSAMTQYINKLYKQRKGKGDPFLTVEGQSTDDWMCLDFGNIVVHFMLEETRTLYELEKLWMLGKEFDDHIQQWDQQVLLFNQEMDLDAQANSGEQGESQQK